MTGQAGEQTRPGGTEEVLVPARSGRALRVEAGSLIEVVDVEGKQVADFVAFTDGDLTEWLSPTHTRSALARLRLHVGDELLSNRREPMFRVVRDDVGVHDLLFAMCDTGRYSHDYGIACHANCRDNLTSALAGYGVTDSWQVPDPVNVFQNSPVDAGWGIGSEEPRSSAGDAFVLQAVRDVIIGVSACPQDQNPCNGWNPTAILIRVHSAD
ncbi:MAG: DUF1989 domain-containing protein [Streptosporangiaceae bacterium]